MADIEKIKTPACILWLIILVFLWIFFPLMPGNIFFWMWFAVFWTILGCIIAIGLFVISKRK